MQMSVRVASIHAAIFLALATSAASAHADAAGDKVLASVDAALNKAKTLRLDVETLDVQPGKPDVTQSCRISTKGDKYFSEYFSPANFKGTKLLILSAVDAYVYLPSFAKIRRILPNGAEDQSFFGFLFGLDDLYRTHYAPQYDAVVAADSPKEWKLTLTAKAGQKPRSPKIEMTVAKDHAVPTELKFFDDKGALVKTETRSAYNCEGDVCTAGERKMVDAKTAGRLSKLIVKSRKVNDVTITDAIFSKSNLGQ